ncbi:hypothetical protein KKA17_01865 [bacterium]|nr:hypothetical protein [bacterium]MBU1882728.1 hypothetical protein [bacterium]
MKRQILIITVLLTNIALGAALPINNRVEREIDTNKKNTNTLAGAASRYLFNKGLDKSVADKKVLNSLGGNEYKNSLMAKNLIDSFSGIKHEDIVAYIGECALYGRCADLSSYDEIIGLIQQKSRLALDKTALKKIEKISLENSKIKNNG